MQFNQYEAFFVQTGDHDRLFLKPGISMIFHCQYETIQGKQTADCDGGNYSIEKGNKYIRAEDLQAECGLDQKSDHGKKQQRID